MSTVLPVLLPKLPMWHYADTLTGPLEKEVIVTVPGAGRKLFITDLILSAEGDEYGGIVTGGFYFGDWLYLPFALQSGIPLIWMACGAKPGGDTEENLSISCSEGTLNIFMLGHYDGTESYSSEVR